MVAGPHRGAGHAGGAEAAVRRAIDRRRVRAARAPGSGGVSGAAVRARSARLLRKEMLPHPARPPDAGGPAAAAGRAGPPLRLCDPHRRARRPAGDRRSDAGRAHAARCANRLEATRRFRIVAVSASTAALERSIPAPARRTSPSCCGLVRGRAGARRRAPVLIITDATEPNTGSAMQSYVRGGARGLRARAARRRRRGSGAHPTGKPDALQPHARELQPVRARADGVRADASSRR